MKYWPILFVIIACGRESSQKKELLSLTEYTSELYTLEYNSFGRRMVLRGSVQIEGAGLHLKLNTMTFDQGYLFLVLDNNSRCSKENSRRPMWSLNNDFSRHLEFGNGFDLSEGKVRVSYDFYQLMKFLRAPKKGFNHLENSQKLALEHRTLLFYYSHSSYSEEDQLILVGCAEFHST